MYSGFGKIADWKDFERLCADLLEAEGYIIESEPFVDRMGTDIVAVEVYKAHDPSREIHVRWMVQCKHYAKSGNNLGRKEVEEILNSYGANKKHNDGLFIIIDTDYTESAKQVIDKYVSNYPEVKITLWNQRQLITRLERHPHLLLRYDLPFPRIDFLSILAFLKGLGPVRTLIISDQSALAHDLTSVLRTGGFDITFLPFWNYLDETRMKLYESVVLLDEFQFIVCFLGDSFGQPLPTSILKIIERCYKKGVALLMFPFLAWSVNHGLYASIEDIIPVTLQDPLLSNDLNIERIIGNYRHGDFRWLLKFDSFAENQYVEFNPEDGKPLFSNGIDTKFGLAHSFEYLTVKSQAELLWADTTGNPMVVASQNGQSKVCYLNTCTHSCMTSVAITSPFEVAPQFSQLVGNILKWLLK